MRADKPLQSLLFQYQTELVRPGASSCIEATGYIAPAFRSSLLQACSCRSPQFTPQEHRLKSIILYSPSLVLRSGASLQPIFMKFPGACVEIVPPCLRASNLLQHFIFRSRSIGEVPSHGNANRVTPLRRCESIRSLDRHRWSCVVCLSVWPNRLNRQLSERGCG
jgi:hypothetical protein